MAIATDGSNVVGWHNFLAQTLEAKIVSLVSVNCRMRTASLRPVTILPQICTIWCTKLRKHFNAIMEVLYCLTVTISFPGDASDCNLDKRLTIAAYAKQGFCRVRARCKILAIWAAVKQLSENENDAMCVVLLRILKTKNFNMVLSFLSTLPPHQTELSKIFQVVCFNFAQMKAYIELWINKLSGAAGKSELNANCEKLDSELGELRMPDGLPACVCQVSWHFVRAPKDWQIDHPHTQNGRQEWMNQLPGHLFDEPPRKNVCQAAAKIIEPKLMKSNTVFVAAAALQNKFPLYSNFSRNPGSMPRRIHVFCQPPEGIRPGSSWKALEGVAGVRCSWVPLAGCQITVFLLRRMCPCWRS